MGFAIEVSISILPHFEFLGINGAGRPEFFGKNGRGIAPGGGVRGRKRGGSTEPGLFEAPDSGDRARKAAPGSPPEGPKPPESDVVLAAWGRSVEAEAPEGGVVLAAWGRSVEAALNQGFSIRRGGGAYVLPVLPPPKNNEKVNW